MENNCFDAEGHAKLLVNLVIINSLQVQCQVLQPGYHELYHSPCVVVVVSCVSGDP